MEKSNSEIETEERLSWKMPKIQKLTINLDTADFIVGLQSNVNLAGEG